MILLFDKLKKEKLKTRKLLKRGGWLNLLKKENLWRKSFYPTLLNEVLKVCKKWYLLMLQVVKTKRNKRSGGCILQIFIRNTFKTWNAM